MKKDFKQELTELINKHGLEKEMRDTPDYILAENGGIYGSNRPP